MSGTDDKTLSWDTLRNLILPSLPSNNLAFWTSKLGAMGTALHNCFPDNEGMFTVKEVDAFVSDTTDGASFKTFYMPKESLRNTLANLTKQALSKFEQQNPIRGQDTTALNQDNSSSSNNNTQTDSPLFPSKCCPPTTPWGNIVVSNPHQVPFVNRELEVLHILEDMFLSFQYSYNKEQKPVFPLGLTSQGMGKSTFCCEWLPSIFRDTGKHVVVHFALNIQPAQQKQSIEGRKMDLEMQYNEIRSGNVADHMESRCRFLNVLYRAYQSNDCFGLSIKDIGDVLSRYKDDPAFCGLAVLKLALMSYISSKYGGFRVAFGQMSIYIPKHTPLEIDALVQLGTLKKYYPFLDTSPSSWADADLPMSTIINVISVLGKSNKTTVEPFIKLEQAYPTPDRLCIMGSFDEIQTFPTLVPSKTEQARQHGLHALGDSVRTHLAHHSGVIMLPLYVGIHVAFQWDLFEITEMTVSTFVLDSIRKSVDIDKMFVGVGLPPVFIVNRKQTTQIYPLKVSNWIKNQCYLLGCVPRFLVMLVDVLADHKSREWTDVEMMNTELWNKVNRYISKALFYLDALPPVLYEYLILVGTTGVVAVPDDKVFPPLLINEAKLCPGVEELDIKEYSALTFNKLSAMSVLYPLRAQKCSREPVNVGPIKAESVKANIVKPKPVKPEPVKPEPQQREYCIPPALYKSWRMNLAMEAAIGDLNFNSLSSEVFEEMGHTQSEFSEERNEDEAIRMESVNKEDFGTESGKTYFPIVKDLAPNPAITHLRAKSNARNQGHPLERVTAASLYSCYKVAVARAGQREGTFIPLSHVWRGLPSRFEGVEVAWRGVEQLRHKHQQGRVQHLDTCIVYRNAEGAENADIIFQARTNNNNNNDDDDNDNDNDNNPCWITIGIQCRDRTKPLSAAAILEECRKSLPHGTVPAPHHMKWLFFVAPEVEVDGNFPKLVTVARKIEQKITTQNDYTGEAMTRMETRLENVQEVVARKVIDDAAYEFYEQSKAVWITNGRGLVSRLWLDFATDRPLDFYSEDDGGATFFQKKTRCRETGGDTPPEPKRPKYETTNNSNEDNKQQQGQQTATRTTDSNENRQQQQQQRGQQQQQQGQQQQQQGQQQQQRGQQQQQRGQQQRGQQQRGQQREQQHHHQHQH